MAWLQSPDGKKKVNVRSGSDAFWTHYKAGWTDVTKPSSERQDAQRKRWREGGEIHSAISTLRRLKKNSMTSRLSKDCIDTLVSSLQFDLKHYEPEKNNG